MLDIFILMFFAIIDLLILSYIFYLLYGLAAVAWRLQEKDEADWPSTLLVDAPVDFCFWSLFRVLTQKQNYKRSCFPMFFSDALM